VTRQIASAALFLAVAAPLAAQEVRLQSRMDPETYQAVRMIIYSATKAGLPARPIEDKALEGASARAPGPVIVSAVRRFTAQLGTASSALGRQAPADDLRAAVGAIDAGVPTRDLIRLRAAADPKDRPLATALTVINDIVVRGVPVPTAANLVISLLRARVKDAELLDFDRALRSDIAHGADPSTAASARAKGTILTFGISRPERR
jgi:hypothetical protein